MILESIINAIREDFPISRALLCSRSTVVKSKRMGLAYNFKKCGEVCENNEPRELNEWSGFSAKEFAKKSFSKNILEASFGVAAINSLIEVDFENVIEKNAFELICEKAEGKRVVVVGHFPFVERLNKIASSLDVLELNPQEGDLPAECASEVIPKSDVVAITGTTLVNHTLEELLNLSAKAYTIILGPTTVLSPVFFDYGADAICGSVVLDEEGVLKQLSAGDSFRNMTGVKRVCLRKD